MEPNLMSLANKGFQSRLYTQRTCWQAGHLCSTSLQLSTQKGMRQQPRQPLPRNRYFIIFYPRRTIVFSVNCKVMMIDLIKSCIFILFFGFTECCSCGDSSDFKTWQSCYCDITHKHSRKELLHIYW